MFPWVSGHVVDGACLFPGTGYQEIAFERGYTTLSDIHYERPLILSDKISKVTVKEDGLKLQVSSDAGVHFSCRFGKESHMSEEKKVNVNQLLGTSSHYSYTGISSSLTQYPPPSLSVMYRTFL